MTSMMEVLYELPTGHPHDFLILVHSNSGDEAFKSAGHLPEFLLDPDLGHAYEPNKTAFNRAHDTKDVMWSWLEHPDNKSHLVRFGAAMNGLKNMVSENAILEGLVTLRSIHHIPLSHFKNTEFHRIPLGAPSSRFAGCRCRRRRWIAILYAR